MIEDSRQDQLADIANSYIKRELFSGIEWLVEQDGAVLSRGQAGFADAPAGKHIPEQAIYRIYSMTKPVVSVLALKLVEQGRLRLYDILPKFDSRFGKLQVLRPDGRLLPAERPVTVEDLLTHRAGFTYEFITGCHIAPLYEKIGISGDGLSSLDEMMSRVAALPLAFQPGSQFRYSVATDVLAHVIERATDRPIDELLRDQIFDPLGMSSTAFCVPEADRSRLMRMFGVADISEFAALSPRPQKLVYADVDGFYPSDRPQTFRRGGHGLFSTLDDYARFARMLLDGKSADGETILSRKMLEMMRCNRIPPRQLPLRIGMLELPGYGFGLGVRVMVDTGAAMSLSGMGEFGWAGAASTYFWVDPLERMIGLVMTQYLASLEPLNDDMRSAAYQLLD